MSVLLIKPAEYEGEDGFLGHLINYCDNHVRKPFCDLSSVYNT